MRAEPAQPPRNPVHVHALPTHRSAVYVRTAVLDATRVSGFRKQAPRVALHTEEGDEPATTGAIVLTDVKDAVAAPFAYA